MKKLLLIALAICVFSAGAVAQDDSQEVTVYVKNMPVVLATNLGKANVVPDSITGFGAEESFVVEFPKAPRADGSNIPVFAYANHPVTVHFTFEPFWRKELDYSGGAAAQDVYDHLDTKFELTLHYTDINTDPDNVYKMSKWGKNYGDIILTKMNATGGFHPHDGLIRGDLGFTVKTEKTNKFAKNQNAVSPDAGLYQTKVYIDYYLKPYVK